MAVEEVGVAFVCVISHFLDDSMHGRSLQLRFQMRRPMKFRPSNKVRFSPTRLIRTYIFILFGNFQLSTISQRLRKVRILPSNNGWILGSPICTAH